MDKIIRILSHKVKNLELEKKNLSKQNAQTTTGVITHSIEGLHFRYFQGKERNNWIRSLIPYI